MTRLVLCLLLLATGASASPLPYGVRVFHDDERGASCWIYQPGSGVGISCIPDSQLQAGNERQLSPHEQQDNGPTPAGAQAQRIEERYSL
ncbi:hypothetical protein HU720_05420 [Pseudomonas sp. SWRI51]|uniref:hypothetical protein n=1 Tax=Pseudomonas sp. SWRI51 TaxID=2745491 RepID=UPI0016447DC1|nr:hypothetical protein [Pseudomonas sp. SWRI51]MBC3410737.1 hypothetical protein [Pseudomonas sp. SWRI51]